MIKCNLNNGYITCIVNDRNLLEDYIKKYINELVDDTIFLSSDNREFVIIILKRLLVKHINEQLTLEENLGYIVEITIDDEKLRFSLVKLNEEKIGNGYSIALTLQD